ncbi:MAG: class I SAM-dependent methyltransferase [Gammaproteobacteria bacterium]
MTARRTSAAKAAVAQVLRRGDTAVDATLGNGHDTLFLAGHVGPEGRVWSFDIQPAALTQARQQLLTLPRSERGDVTLIEDSHERMLEHLPADQHGRVGAVMFNLGYLPGGDKTLTTTADTTVVALTQATQLLRPGGLLSVIAYVGHPTGREEMTALSTWIATNDKTVRWTEHEKGASPPLAPRLFLGVRC